MKKELDAEMTAEEPAEAAEAVAETEERLESFGSFESTESAENVESAEAVDGADVGSAEPSPEEIAAKKKKKRRVILLTSIIAAVVVLLAAVALILWMNSPKMLMRSSTSRFIGDAQDRDEVKIMLDVLDGGSLDIAYEQEKNGQKNVIEGKMYFGKKDFLLDDLKIAGDGKELNIDLYLNEGYGYVESEELFGDKLYGYVKGEMLDAFESSMFRYKSGSDYEIPDPDVDMAIAEILWAYDEEIIDDFLEDGEKLIARYTNHYRKAIEKYGEYELEYVQADTGGDYVNARKITLTLDEDALMEVDRYVYSKLKKDKDVEKFVEEYAEVFEYTLIKLGVLEEDHDEILDIYDDMLDEFDDYVDDEDNYEDESYEIELAMSVLTNKLYRIRITENDEETLLLDVGKDGIKNSKEIRTTVDGETYVYTVRENNKNEYVAKLETEADDEDATLFSISIDRESEKFKLTFGEGDNKVSLNGSIETEKDTTTVVVDEFKVGGSKEDVGELTIIIDKNDKMPEIRRKGEVDNVLDITEEDIEDIKKHIEKLFGGLVA